MTEQPSAERFDVFGVSISAVNMRQAVAIIDDWVRTGRREYVVLTGAHGVIEMQTNSKLREINNSAGLVTPDGMSVVWHGRRQGFKHIEKVYGPTLMKELFGKATRSGHRHFLYGGKDGVADRLADRVRERFPGIEIVGTFCPPFRPLKDAEKAAVADRINATRPDIVWVGLGCPKQERWMADFRGRLDASVLIGVGAGFDFLAGERPLAPRVIQNSGFEWLYRLASDPKYLWGRYRRVVPRFVWLTIREMFWGRDARGSGDNTAAKPPASNNDN